MTHPSESGAEPRAAGGVQAGDTAPGADTAQAGDAAQASAETIGEQTGAAQSGASAAGGELPPVAVVMGSDSDWPVMGQAVDALAEFDVPAHVDVLSAHRMPQEMLDFGASAAERGVQVIIAGAGGAAHLPGMLASVTPLPVIGVPVPLTHLDGMDSLLSIVQMPAGVPVATVSVGGARNAGLLAVRILAAGTGQQAQDLRAQMVAFQADLADSARAKGQRLRAKRSQRPGFSA